MDEKPRKARYQKDMPLDDDLTDEEWALIEPLLPYNEGAGRNVELDLHHVLNAIFYLLRTGCQWRLLPKIYPNSNSVYYHFSKWCRDGTLARNNRALYERYRVQLEHEPTPSAAIIDSQTVKTTEVPGTRGYDGAKK